MDATYVLRREVAKLKAQRGETPTRITMRQELREHVNRTMRDDLIAEVPGVHGDYLLGIPLVVDNRLPPGRVEFDIPRGIWSLDDKVLIV